MDNETRQALEKVEAGLDARMQAMKTEILERIEQSETRLLRAFHAYAQSTDLKLAALSLHEQRLAVIERRITQVEGRLDEHHIS